MRYTGMIVTGPKAGEQGIAAAPTMQLARQVTLPFTARSVSECVKHITHYEYVHFPVLQDGENMVGFWVPADWTRDQVYEYLCKCVEFTTRVCDTVSPIR